MQIIEEPIQDFVVMTCHRVPHDDRESVTEVD